VPAAAPEPAPTATPPAPTATTPAPTATTPAPTPAPAGTTPAPAGTPQPAPEVSDDAIRAAAETNGKGADKAPGPIILLAVVGGLLLVAAAWWALARWWAWEPAWMVRARHATGEAGWRTSAAWAEFRDWLRLGR
jgi:hypothetical protein